ncbi:hypothetical protein B4N89_46310 [Embleya scabrispora]|uniref:Integrase catalytic domain-containing protein n=2 Tax=Embleya scabrispora TaxID=159449 RepID=A0A1T3NIS0_9ACTN|nr:hypothetical protein B4N89_46310 [Embleya scabrispora]
MVVDAPDFAVLDGAGRALPAARVPDLSALDLLTEAQLRRVRDWERHLIEVVEGRLPDADPEAPPRPGFDPTVFTLRRRDAAKAAELRALGWTKASAATVERRRRAYAHRGVAGLVREVTAGAVWGRTDERVVALLLAEVDAGVEESSGHASRLHERLLQALRKRYPDEHEQLAPSRATFYRLLQRLGISVGSLAAPVRRRMDAANSPDAPFTPSMARMLGEQVQIDSTGLDVIALGDDGRPVSLELTAAIDVATRTIIGAVIVPRSAGRGPRGRRLGGRATRSFDAVLMLAQALAPMPGRPGWSPLAMAENSEMPYADLVACDPRMIGAAARPVIRPKMIVVDHGKIFNSEHFVDVCTTLGISVRPARMRTPTDKAIVESTFAAIKKLFCQHVAGYTGAELAKRGKHVTDGPLWSINEVQDLLDEWIALHWQQKPHEGLRSPFLPGVTVSPNRMYAALVAAEGHVPMPLTVSQNRRLLPFKRLKVTRKGVRIDNRTYNSASVQRYFGKHSGLRGQGMKWQVRYNPYAPRYVWLYDHHKEKTGEDPWVEAEFVHQRLIGDHWSQYLWEQATASLVATGGCAGREREIAREVARLLERARRGPDPAVPRPAGVFTGPRLRLRSPAPDPYAGIPAPDPATVTRAPSLNVAAEDLLPGRRAAPSGGAEAAGGDAPMPGPAVPDTPAGLDETPAAAGTRVVGGPGAGRRGGLGESAADVFASLDPPRPATPRPGTSEGAADRPRDTDDGEEGGDNT